MLYLGFALVGILSFLLGSIPFGIVIGKLLYKKDIREVGSGNIGTTNAIRALGKAGGYAVFVLDFGKGLASGFIALALWSAFGGDAPGSAFPAQADYRALSFFACTLGHIFSPWLKFKGGKGIAVAVGCQFSAFGPVWAILELSIFAVLVIATRYVSVGSIAAASACVVLSFIVFAGHPVAIALAAICGSTVVWAHRENIGRLMRGEENRIGKKSS